MRDFQLLRQSDGPDQELHTAPYGGGDPGANHQNAIARTALLRSFSEHDPLRKKERRENQKLCMLIEELKCLQPAHLSELSESLGQSTTTTRTQLEKLKRINLVVSTHFEHYTLFCLNGDFNLFFSQLLSAFYEHA